METQVNRRARVTPISIEELEHLYSMRIVSESLALQVSVPRFGRSDVEKLLGHLGCMEALGGHDVAQWRTAHREFHLALLVFALSYGAQRFGYDLWLRANGQNSVMPPDNVPKATVTKN